MLNIMRKHGPRKHIMGISIDLLWHYMWNSEVIVERYYSYLAMKLLTTHSTSHTGYYLCLFMQTKFQLGS